MKPNDYWKEKAARIERAKEMQVQIFVWSAAALLLIATAWAISVTLQKEREIERIQHERDLNKLSVYTVVEEVRS